MNHVPFYFLLLIRRWQSMIKNERRTMNCIRIRSNRVKSEVANKKKEMIWLKRRRTRRRQKKLIADYLSFRMKIVRQEIPSNDQRTANKWWARDFENEICVICTLFKHNKIKFYKKRFFSFLSFFLFELKIFHEEFP